MRGRAEEGAGAAVAHAGTLRRHLRRQRRPLAAVRHHRRRGAALLRRRPRRHQLDLHDLHGRLRAARLPGLLDHRQEGAARGGGAGRGADGAGRLAEGAGVVARPLRRGVRGADAGGRRADVYAGGARTVGSPVVSAGAGGDRLRPGRLRQPGGHRGGVRGAGGGGERGGRAGGRGPGAALAARGAGGGAHAALPAHPLPVRVGAAGSASVARRGGRGRPVPRAAASAPAPGGDTQGAPARGQRWRRGRGGGARRVGAGVRRVAAGAGAQPGLRAAVVRVRAERGRVLRGVDAAQPDAAGALPRRGGGRRARGAGDGGGGRGGVRGGGRGAGPLAPLQAHHAAGVRDGAGRPAGLRLRPALRQPRRRLRQRRAARILHHRVPGRGLRVRGSADAGRAREHVVGHAERGVGSDGHRAHAGRRGAAGAHGRPPHQPLAHRRPRAGLPAVGARPRRRPARARRRGRRRRRRRRRRQVRRRRARAAGAPGEVLELICRRCEDWQRMRELPVKNGVTRSHAHRVFIACATASSQGTTEFSSTKEFFEIIEFFFLQKMQSFAYLFLFYGHIIIFS